MFGKNYVGYVAIPVLVINGLEIGCTIGYGVGYIGLGGLLNNGVFVKYRVGDRSIGALFIIGCDIG